MKGFCSAREDGAHCEHWWDGEECHSCGAPAMTYEQKLEQGMLVPGVDEDSLSFFKRMVDEGGGLPNALVHTVMTFELDKYDPDKILLEYENLKSRK